MRYMYKDIIRVADDIILIDDKNFAISFLSKKISQFYGIAELSVIINPLLETGRIIMGGGYPQLSRLWEDAVSENPDASKSRSYPIDQLNSYLWGVEHGDHHSGNILYDRFVEGCGDVGLANNMTTKMMDGGGSILINMMGIPKESKKLISKGAGCEDVCFLVKVFNDRFVSRGGADGSRYSPLSPKEIEALRWVANGLRPAEVAEKMRISDWTVREYLSSAKHKLNARTLYQAVAKAIAWSFIRL